MISSLYFSTTYIPSPLRQDILCSPFIPNIHGSGTHFTKSLWAHNPNLEKIWNALTWKIIIKSGHKFAHVTTAMLSWHVQIFDLTGLFGSYLKTKLISQDFSYELINPSWDGSEEVFPAIFMEALPRLEGSHIWTLQGLCFMEQNSQWLTSIIMNDRLNIREESRSVSLWCGDKKSNNKKKQWDEHLFDIPQDIFGRENISILSIHLPLYKMAFISQTTFSSAFSWMKKFAF